MISVFAASDTSPCDFGTRSSPVIGGSGKASEFGQQVPLPSSHFQKGLPLAVWTKFVFPDELSISSKMPFLSPPIHPSVYLCSFEMIAHITQASIRLTM